ncbi:CoA transferase [Pseudomonas sp. JS3066]|uniref:CaiB/BaiF CoA transferase family protein n=1 Tax=unclassified Pseudomonas TaxID=196821 RepID=UPI000EAA1D31|nr:MULTISPECIES: CoA transferase [unclassified Pseudomonas]AYF86866.1 CoA transferase [Pseudomonas sp. DY-1]MDH4652277.1 CoA transferase [Pseudomonas sp. BN606]MRK24288.1 CoA transferase [Pseudomonas sp. JG-B]WVK95646.1 CoA transferase [Pseudomonas sp. JS3066]
MLRNALQGLTVLDFTQIAAGPTCTMLLADMGARVIKVEPPEGDLGRTLGPAWVGDSSALYHGFNRGKQGLCLDLKNPQGLAVAKRLLEEADVLIESMRPGVMARLGLGFEAAQAINPALVYCSISAYGQQGPYADRAGVDGILQADSGLMSLIGTPGAPPCKVQAPVVDVVTGYMACMAILAKLQARHRDGQGGHLDVSLMNSALALQQSSISSYLRDGELPTPIGSAAPYSAPNEAFQTEDGWLMVAAYNGNRWERLCTVLGNPQWSSDPRFVTSAQRVVHRAEMQEALNGVFRTRSTAHWLERLREADILCARVADYSDLLEHPQLASNGMLATIEHPRHGELRVPGFPVNSAEAAQQPYRPAPDKGEHSRELLVEMGFSELEVEEVTASGAVIAA